MAYEKGTREYDEAVREYSYNKEDYLEADVMLRAILQGEYRAPSELVVRIYEERSDLRKKIRRHEQQYCT